MSEMPVAARDDYMDLGDTTRQIYIAGLNHIAGAEGGLSPLYVDKPLSHLGITVTRRFPAEFEAMTGIARGELSVQAIGSAKTATVTKKIEDAITALSPGTTETYCIGYDAEGEDAHAFGPTTTTETEGIAESIRFAQRLGTTTLETLATNKLTFTLDYDANPSPEEPLTVEFKIIRDPMLPLNGREPRSFLRMYLQEMLAGYERANTRCEGLAALPKTAPAFMTEAAERSRDEYQRAARRALHTLIK